MLMTLSLRSHRRSGAMANITMLRPIEDAPRDGTPVLIKLKDRIHVSGGIMDRWQGKVFVGIHRKDAYHWSFDAPIGVGYIRDEWIEGWAPRPALSPPATKRS
jgi:hypothetical protein